MKRLLASLVSIYSNVAWACTTFRMAENGPTIVAKSYDWNHDDGIIHRNPVGLNKKGLLLDPKDNALEWTSKHASLTFNQYGREMPNGGMNDAGLVVEIMWLNEAEWPKPDHRPAVNELQWIQYQLDVHATTQAVIEQANQIRVAPIHGEVHYMVCDASGDCATFEYLDGQLVVHHGDEMAFAVLTNHTYDQSLAHVQARKGQAPASGSGSLSRFHRAAVTTQSDASVDQAWAGLESVQWDRTQWQIVYEPKAGRIQFRTRGHREIRSISLNAEPSSCEQPVQVLSMQAPLSGDVTNQFSDYDIAANERLVQTGVQQLNGTLPQGVMDAVAHFPSQLVCAE